MAGERYTFIGNAEEVTHHEWGLTLEAAPQRGDGGGPTDAGTASGGRDESRRARVDVRMLAPDIVHVRMIPPAARHPASPGSYAVVWEPSEPPPFRRENADDGIVLETSALTVHVNMSPVRITFMRPDGSVFGADAPDGGMGWRRHAVVCRKVLSEKERCYGLGEHVGPLDVRGRQVTMWNTDISPHLPDTDPMYASFPFLIGFEDGRAFGLFFDNTFRSRFNVGRSEEDIVSFGADGGYMNYYVLAGPGLGDVVERYTELTGRMALPPLWALGYHQSRYSYETEQDVMDVARTMRERDLPCDAIYLDIHYMDGYRIFTFDRNRFPDPRGLTERLKERGFRTVVIVDPAIKVDPDYPVYREGTERGYWATGRDGAPYRGAVWPGEAVFPDFTRPEVRSWWAAWHRRLFDAGVDGIWNDMNEPADFSGPGRTLPPDALFGPDDAPIPHGEVHNVYGHLMAAATQEAFAAWRSGRRPFIITRAGYSGTQRSAVMWTGDNSSWWEHLLMSVPMGLNMGLSGMPFVGADIGGFLGDCDGELLARWIQLGAFMPLFRNHSVIGSRRQEPYAFGEPYESVARRYLKFRYRLIPYLYTLVHEAAARGTPIMRPMVWEFPDDPRTYRLFDQFMLGPYLLVAPVVQPGATARSVYLPPGPWIVLWTGEEVTGGRHVAAEAPLETIPLFLRAGAVLPYGREMAHTGERPQALEQIDVYPAAPGRFSVYVDDGETLAYREGRCGFIVIEHRRTDRGVAVSVHRDGEAPWPVGVVRINGVRRAPEAVTVNGRALGPAPSREAVPAGAAGWWYERSEGRLYVGVHGDEAVEIAVVEPDTGAGVDRGAEP